MKDIIQEEKSIVFSFKQLIDIQKERYKKATTTIIKEDIASKLICDPGISKDLLTIFSDLIKKIKIILHLFWILLKIIIIYCNIPYQQKKICIFINS